jgi:hypothetical protein
VKPAAAGALAALVWAAVEPFDRRVFANDYSDVAMLGKLVTRSRAWPIAGLAIHAANGAVFGAAHDQLRRRLTPPPSALQLALAEHVLLYPLTYLVDRKHPRRGERGVAPAFTLRGFAQETMRHALFGAVLGRLEEGA